MHINGDGSAFFPNTSQNSGGRITGTFSFLEEEDRRSIFLQLHFQHSLFRATVEISNIPGDELHWLTVGGGGEKFC